MRTRLSTVVLLLIALSCTARAAPPSHAPAILSLALDRSGRILAAGDQHGRIHLLSFPGLRPVRVLEGHTDGVSSLDFRRDGHILCSGSLDRTVRLWRLDAPTPPTVLGPHSDDVLSVSLSPDGRTLAAASYDGVCVLWDIGRRQRRAPRLSGHTAEFSPDGRLLATASVDGKLRLYSSEGHETASWAAHNGCPNVARFRPDGRQLVSCVDKVKIWDVKTHRLLYTLDTGRPQIQNGASWAPDGGRIAVSTLIGGGVDFRWRGKAWVRGASLPGRFVQRAIFSPDGRFVILGDLHGEVRVMGAADGRIARRWTVPLARDAAPR